MSISFDETCMRIPILNGTLFYLVIICYISFLLKIVVTCKMYLPASKHIVDFVSSIIKHSLIYTAQDQNYIVPCHILLLIHFEVPPHIIIAYLIESYDTIHIFTHTDNYTSLCVAFY